MAEFVRVRDSKTGYEYDVAHPRDGHEVIDDVPVSAPRPPKFATIPVAKAVSGREKKSVATKEKETE